VGDSEKLNDGSRSIGEILDDLRGDFPDISVSKIRFLESQGLITPERSPSGYRQFTEGDLDLLRWILRQQRDHYLPLKVIRRRLKDGDGPGREVDGPGPAEGTAATAAGGAPPAGAARTAAASVAVDEARLTLPDPAPPAPPDEDAVWLVPADGPDPAGASGPAPPSAGIGAPSSSSAGPSPSGDELWPAGGEGRYSRNDIRQQTGLDERSMTELESFGLLPPAGPEGFGPEALRVAEIAAGFFAYGVEARHLRMYKSFAEREAAFLGQVVMPMANAKDAAAGARAAEALTELARLGAALRLSMLRVGIGPSPRGTGGAPPTTAAAAAKE
jgi:DNA-binding transcriptional MerR regulator